MGAFKLLSTFLMGLAFSYTIFWKEKTIEIKVPKNSVITIELPCKVESVFVNNFVSADYKGNGVFISVGDVPSSVGISCRKGDIFRNYSLYLFPSHSGITFLKIVDKELQRRYLTTLTGRDDKSSVSDKSIILEAEKLLKAIVKGKSLSGYELIEVNEIKRSGRFEIKQRYIWIGRSLIGVLFSVRNTSYMQRKVSKEMFFKKGVVMVWLEKEGWLKPDEEIIGAIVKLKNEKVRGKRKGYVIPFKEVNR